jgi:Fuc2NAc and GlcNAc transferase
MTEVLLLAASSAATSLVLTGLVRRYTLRRGVLDRPNARSSHSAPTPRGGGVALILASAMTMAIAVALKLTRTSDALTLGSGMLVVGAVGWRDDTRGLRPAVRLTVHLAVAFWTVYMFHGLPVVRVGSTSLAVGAAGYLLGVLGIVWSINLFNFMDGIDGLAASQAVLIFGSGALLLFFRGDHSLGTVSACVAGSSAGFLVWNWPPAKIFLGDVGSGAIGYLVAALAIASENNRSVPLLAFAIISGLFVADATITLMRRVARGERPAEAHRDHAYQRLTRAWNSHRAVTAGAAVVTLVLAAFAAIGTIVPRFLLLSFCVACLILAALLLTVERRAPM